jgi:hypothetical protein
MIRLALAAMLALALVPLRAGADVAPLLVVYRFTVDGGVQPTVGERFADAVADDARGPGIIVMRGVSTLTPAQFRGDARKSGADYLLTGAIAAVGNRYAVLVQLVSVRTGLIAWGTTVQAGGAGDLLGIGAQARQVLLDQLGHASFPAPAKASAPSLATGDATPAPAASHPPTTYAVLSLGGSALPSDRALAVREVLDVIRKHGASAIADALPGEDVLAAGAQACEDTGAATIVGGTLDTTHLDQPAAAADATVAFQVYDCRTQTVLAKPLAAEKSAQISSEAIRTAAQAAMAAYFAAPSPAPHG